MEILICIVAVVFILLLVLYVLLAEFKTQYEDDEDTTAEEIIKRYLKDDMFKD
jgi:uncharacterized membrane protein